MAEEQKQEVKTEAVPAKDTGTAPAAEKKSAKAEISRNCAECNKPVKKIHYYRNMKFFCNKKCWNSFKKKNAAKDKPEAQKQEEKAA